MKIPDFLIDIVTPKSPLLGYLLDSPLESVRESILQLLLKEYEAVSVRDLTSFIRDNQNSDQIIRKIEDEQRPQLALFVEHTKKANRNFGRFNKTKVNAITRISISLFVIVLFLVVFYLLITKNVGESAKDAVLMIAGAVSTQFGSVINFWLSNTKDEKEDNENLGESSKDLTEDISSRSF